MQIFWIFFKQELLLASQNLAKILQNFLFFPISLTTFSLAIYNISSQNSEQFLVAAILFCLIFSSIFSNSDFMNDDFTDGTLEQIAIMQPNLEIFVLSKIISNWVIFSLPILLTIPFLSFLLGINQILSPIFFVTIFLTSLISNFICSFCGSLGIVKNKAPLIAIIALPLIIPILLIANSTLLEIELSSNAAPHSVKILSGICVFAGAISVLATTKIVKIISE